MTIARKRYLFVSALFVFLVVGLPTEVEAQDGGDGGEGLTCGWCLEHEHDVLGLVHWFPRGGDACGWPNPGAGHQCSRCGGTSGCHPFHHPKSGGPCHIPCGGTEVQQALSNAASDLGIGLDAMDLVRVAETLAAGHEGFSVEYLPNAGRIDLLLACAPSTPAATVPVLPEIRPALGRALMKPVAAIAVRSGEAWRKRTIEG